MAVFQVAKKLLSGDLYLTLFVFDTASGGTVRNVVLPVINREEWKDNIRREMRKSKLTHFYLSAFLVQAGIL